MMMMMMLMERLHSLSQRWKWWTYGQEGEMVAQHGAQGYRCGDIHLGELGGGHLALCALAEVDGAHRQRQSPQAAALRQLSCRGAKHRTEMFSLRQVV